MFDVVETKTSTDTTLVTRWTEGLTKDDEPEIGLTAIPSFHETGLLIRPFRLN
jgi:hypothetical protein